MGCCKELTRGLLLVFTTISTRKNKRRLITVIYSNALIATGDATTDGQIVISHSTHYPYFDGPHWMVIVEVAPEKGHTFCYQTSGGVIWSGCSWYKNEAGLKTVSTWVPQGSLKTDPEATPGFVRNRRAAQYASSIDEFLNLASKDSNGTAQEWLIGDTQTGEIAYAIFGGNPTTMDVKRKTDGYFRGSNYVWSEKFRNAAEIEKQNLTDSGFARYTRLGQLLKKHYGEIDAERVKKIMADHYDVLLKREVPSDRTLCRHGENEVVGEATPNGAYDAKIASGSFDELGLWARFGHPCGETFNKSEFLKSHPRWAKENQWKSKWLRDWPTSNPWTYFKGQSEK